VFSVVDVFDDLCAKYYNRSFLVQQTTNDAFDAFAMGVMDLPNQT